MPRLKPGTLVPTREEDVVINACIATDLENPEWTDADFARVRPASEVFPGLLGAAASAELLKPKPLRGRPPLDAPKKAIKLRLDPDVIDGFRATGPGWQSRINAVLWDYVQRLDTRD